MAKQFSYSFYHSKTWKQKRLEILHRDKYTCADCGCRATEVHHKIELTPQNINNIKIALGNDNLISLCHNCHTKTTKGNKEIDDRYIFDDNGQVVPQG